MIEFVSSYEKRLRHLVVEVAKIFITPPRVTFVTFSCSEEVLRFLALRKREGVFSALHLIADTTAMRKAVYSSIMSRRLFDSFYYADVHAKIVLLYTDERRVLIVSSENLSRGTRLEVSIVTDDEASVSRAAALIARLRADGKEDSLCQ